jgi:hypothetical protein
MDYITRSNLIVGEISSLKQASKENTSYELSFFGTALDCETTNRVLETKISQVNTYDTLWQIRMPEPECTIQTDAWLSLVPFSGNTSITYRVSHYQDTVQYWPCLDNSRLMPTINDSDGYVMEPFELPGSGIHVLVPVTETVCHPKIVEYQVTISDAGGTQHASYIINEDIPIPAWTPYLVNFNGSLEQWAQLSDAVMIYQDFAKSFNQSSHNPVAYSSRAPSMSDETKLYTTNNGTPVETCVLEAGWTTNVYSLGGEPDIGATVWRLGVFAQRLPKSDDLRSCPAFDPDMANELLINTTISALALNQRFDTVNGTETLNFNAYHFENKLALILPYGLSLALAVPILALGFVALYVQNHGVSAIGGGFLQLLMTTTGRTSLEAVITKGSGTLGGYENISEELREMEVRFGELIEVSGEDQKETDTLLSGREVHAGMQEDNRSQSGFVTTSGMERCENNVSVVQRAGFGTVDEVGLFRKKGE